MFKFRLFGGGFHEDVTVPTLLCIVISFAVVFGFGGCGSDPSEVSDEKEPLPNSDKPMEKSGPRSIIQKRKPPSLNLPIPLPISNPILIPKSKKKTILEKLNSSDPRERMKGLEEAEKKYTKGD